MNSYLQIHGGGVSSKIFTTDLIQTNMLEYLHSRGYDIFVMDTRLSTALQASHNEWKCEDVAKDYFAVVPEIMRLTGAPSIQIVAHCIGNITLNYAFLLGLTGVRSLVSSQVACHPIVGPMNYIKAISDLGNVLYKMGMKYFNPCITKHQTWFDFFLNNALRVYPLPVGQNCRNVVCKR
jgi:cholesterol oxidase